MRQHLIALIIGVACLESCQPMGGNDWSRHDAPVLEESAWYVQRYDQEFANALAVGDVNGDGFEDLAVSSLNGYPTGRVELFMGNSAGLATLSSRTVYGIQDSHQFGLAISMGDSNGDGYSDLLASQPGWGTEQTNRAYLFAGGPLGLSSNAAWVMATTSQTLAFAETVSFVGDLNADGYEDFIVGSPAVPNAQQVQEKAFVFHGRANFDWEGPDSVLPGPGTAPDYAQLDFGRVVAPAGDVNGDGYSDVAIGSPRNNERADGLLEADLGRVDFYYGSSAGLSTAASVAIVGFDSYSRFGTKIAAGDTDGDGYGDVVVAPWSQDEVRLFHGSPTGLQVTPTWEGPFLWAEEFGYWDRCFYCSISLNDFDGDGRDDLLLGESGKTKNNEMVGLVVVLLGTSGGFNSEVAWHRYGAPGDFIGGRSGSMTYADRPAAVISGNERIWVFPAVPVVPPDPTPTATLGWPSPMRTPAEVQDPGAAVAGGAGIGCSLGATRGAPTLALGLLLGLFLWRRR